MPAKNTLTAEDAKMVEERFKASSPPSAIARITTGSLRDLPLVGHLMVLTLPGGHMLSLSKV